MAQGYDGDIKLSVSLSADDVKRSAQSLSNDIRAIFDKSSGKELDSKFQRLQGAMSKSVTKAQELQSAMERLERTEVPTDEYKEIQIQIEKSSAALNRLKERMDKFTETGGKTSSIAFKKMQYDAAQLENTIEYAKGELQDLVDTGRAFKLGSDTEAYENLKNQLGEANNQMRTLLTSAEQYSQTTDKAVAKTNRFSGILRGVKGILGRVGSGLKSLAQRFLHVGNSAQSLGNKLGVSLKSILGYVIGIRGLFALFSKLRSAISSAIADMAKLNGGMNQTNAAMSQLQSSLNLLKGSLAAAFTPILTVVAPILSNFIDQIASVITAIGMMIAKLTGAKSYFRATKTSANYAGGGGGGSGKSAEEKYQEAVEKAQKKYDEQVAKTQEKNAKAAAKAEEQQAKAAKKLAEQQEKANRKLADFDDLNVLNIEDMEELEEIEAEVYDMPELELPDKEDFLGGGGGGAGDPFGLEEVLIEDWEWNWDELLAKAEELGRKLADFLNDIFKDEDLAKKIGNAIGNLINMAIRFAYGFVDEFNFRQFGRWIGSLIQEAIETIDWSTLGSTIGKFVNGIANTIIGFFETYQVGTLGSAIADMINNAIREINPKSVGEAVLDVLQAPLIELSHVLTEANFTLMGQKAGDFIKRVFTKEGLDGQTIGQTIGKTIADLFNAGVDFLLGLKLTTVVSALTIFFEDLFTTALEDIDWMDVLGLAFGRGGLLDAILSMYQRLQYLVSSLVKALISVVMEGLATLFDQLPKPLQVFLRVVPEEYHKTAEELQNTSNELYAKFEQIKDGTITAYDEISGRADDFVYQLENIGNGFTFTADQMQEFVDSGRFTNEQIEKFIEGMEGYAEQSGTVLDKAKLGLDGYEGSWELFVARQELRKDRLLETHKQEETSINNLKDTTDLATTSIRDEMLDLKGQTQTFTDETNANLDSLQQNAGITVTSFEDMSVQLNTSLETLTAYIQEWYDNMVATYFSYDIWTTLLTEGPLLALTDFFNTSFFVTWDEQMQLWWTEHVIIWFTAEKWQTDVYTPWITLFNTKWQSFITKWDSNLKVWWTNHVQPWFEEKKWEDEFMHIYKVAEKVGEKTRDKVGELAEETAEAVHNACDAMKNWIQEIIEMLGEAIEMANELSSIAASAGGGGGSSSGGGSRVGGGNGGGGSSSSRPFMPMLDVMHFEDNLGMSAFKFPELATGAVIPPNNEFLAVLGDQRNGMNIETPLATMMEAFRSVMDEYMSGSHQSATMEVDGETFARLMMPHIMDEMNRLGYNTEIIEGI